MLPPAGNKMNLLLSQTAPPAGCTLSTLFNFYMSAHSVLDTAGRGLGDLTLT